MKPRSSLLQAVLLAPIVLSALGCPKGTAGQAAPKECQQMGQQCELEPGKLGACAYKSDCTGAGCLYCQSQH
jgi:hypothetical protein